MAVDVAGWVGGLLLGGKDNDKQCTLRFNNGHVLLFNSFHVGLV